MSAIGLAFADDVALDVGISRFESGQEAASQVAMTKLLVEDGDGAEYVKTREPRLLTEIGKAAKIEFGSRDGDVLSVSISPRESE